MGVPLFLVDAFAERPFSGNPAAVCLLPAWRDERWLQDVAAEMKQSETAFLVPNTQGFDLRWFSPTVEVDLCGHATLASAHALLEQGRAKPDEPILFSTKSGVLKAVGRRGEVELDFPLTPQEPADPPTDMLPALFSSGREGASAKYVGKSKFDYLVEVESDAVLRALSPDFKRLGAAPVRGIIVTSRSADPRFDFVSRFFAPATGIDEDPATGSSHCCLGDYWRKRLGKSEFTAYQASPRGGVIKVRVTPDRAFLGGKAVTVARGELA